MPRDIFISYRRDGGEHLAARVRESLKSRGYSTFMDIEDLKSGSFDEALLRKIEEATDVVVILTPGCLDRCANEGDWLRREIRHALGCGRNVVPVMGRGFQMPSAGKLPADISDLVRQNGIAPAAELFEASMDRLASKFLLSKPAVKPPPPSSDGKVTTSSGSDRPSRDGLGTLLQWPGTVRGEWALFAYLRKLSSSVYSYAWSADSLPQAGEARGRRVLRGIVCWSYIVIAVGLLALFFIFAIGDVLKQGTHAGIFGSFREKGDFASLFGFLFSVLAMGVGGYIAWRRQRGWACLLLFIVSLIPGAIAVPWMGWDLLRHFGNPFGFYADFLSWLAPLSIVGITAILAAPPTVLVAMQHDRTASWFKCLWNPFISKRPRWLRRFWQLLLAVAAMFILVGAINRLVVAIERRTPLDFVEQDFAKKSWKVTAAQIPPQHQYHSGFFDFHWEQSDVGVVWTFSRGHRLKIGKLGEGGQYRPGDSGFLKFYTPMEVRWRVASAAGYDKGHLYLESFEDAGRVAEYITELSENTLTLTEVGGEEAVIKLTRVPRLEYGDEQP